MIDYYNVVKSTVAADETTAIPPPTPGLPDVDLHHSGLGNDQCGQLEALLLTCSDMFSVHD